MAIAYEAERRISTPDMNGGDVDVEPHGDHCWAILSNLIYDESILLSETNGVIALRNLGSLIDIEEAPWREPITPQLIASLEVKSMRIFNATSLAQYLEDERLVIHRFGGTNYIPGSEPEDIWL